MNSGDEPRVAVIIPCFNDGRTLGATLESLQAQERCAVVVVNDGSTDPETLAILREIPSGDVRVVHQDNQGLAAARMSGVSHSEARYIYPLDSDDLAAPGAIAALADALDQNPEAALAWGNQRSFGDRELDLPRAARLDPWAITYINELPTASLLRREALIAAGGWSMKVAYEDWDLWMALAERGQSGVRVPQTTHLYRVAADRMLGQARSRHTSLYEELKERHPALFAARAANWRRSRAPLRQRLTFPLVDRLPVSQLTRHRLSLALVSPATSVRAWRQRRRGATSGG